VAIAAIIAVTACFSLGLAHSVFIAVALLSIAVGCVCGYQNPFWSMPSEFLMGSSAAAGIALVTMFVSLGGFVGPYAFGYIRQRTGSLYDALAVAGIVSFVFATLILLLPRTAYGRIGAPMPPNSPKS